MPAGTSALWAWIGTDRDPDRAALREATTSAEPNIRAALGATLPGITGFRRSHATALATQGLLAGNCHATARDGVPRHRDRRPRRTRPRPHDRVHRLHPRTARRRHRTGRPPARDPPGLPARRQPRTAHRLNTHRNTILNRVARAEELLGHPIEEHRLELALALELAHWLGVRPAAHHERTQP